MLIVCSCVSVLNQRICLSVCIISIMLLQFLLGLGFLTSVSEAAPAPTFDMNVTADVSVLPSNITQTFNATSGLGDSNAETIEETLNHDAVEGDILADEDRNAVSTLWFDAVIPFEISPAVAHRFSVIDEAFRMIMSKTCVVFVPHTNEVNYIEIKEGEGCASYVGCRGGSQTVYFGETCSAGNLGHELLHAAGLYHEHTRFDRDDFVLVNWHRIKPDRKGNFDVKKGNTLNMPYDLESIMHYGPNFFSVDGGQTLQPLSPGVNMGQRTHLTKLDAGKINRLYHCARK